jgi:hypothetical protein
MALWNRAVPAAQTNNDSNVSSEINSHGYLAEERSLLDNERATLETQKKQVTEALIQLDQQRWALQVSNEKLIHGIVIYTSVEIIIIIVIGIGYCYLFIYFLVRNDVIY